MTFSWEDLIARARVYKDDDHSDERQWLKTEQWMTLFQVEYALLYPRWIRAGLVGPAPTDLSFTGSSTDISDVCAIIGVAEDLGDGRYRPLEPGQPTVGRAPFYDTNEGKSVFWTATGSGDDLTVTLYPPDPTGNYVARYIERPVYETDVTEEVDLPYGADERLVLGVADRAGIKDSTVSRKISELKLDADIALNFLSQQRAAVRVRRVRPVGVSDRYGAPFPTNPTLWKFV